MPDEKVGARAQVPQAAPAPASVGVGDIVLLHVENADPAPAVVLGVTEDGGLNVNDLSGQYGQLYGLQAKTDDSDPLVLSWTTR